MTVALVSAPRRYIGLSSDTKPTPVAGSSFQETDTGAAFVYDGGGWQRARSLPA